jgi:hypothetical protein
VAAAQVRFRSAWAEVARQIWSVFRVRARTLLLAGLVIFVPVGLLETIDTAVWEGVGDGEDLDFLGSAGLVGLGAVDAIGTLIGEVIFAGVVTASVLVERRGDGTSLREAVRKLDPARLALADLAYAFVVVLGLFLLVVPGFLFMVWFALVAPVIEVEHSSIRSAFGRSRALVRRRPWLVAAFVLPIVLLDETLTSLAHAAAVDALGENFFGEWAAGTLTGLVTSLPLALAVVVLYFWLAEAERLASLASYSSSGAPPIRS